MIPPWFVPALSIALNLGSAGVYAAYGDWKRTVYWLAAATLTACVTF
jgi:hypothetical protein